MQDQLWKQIIEELFPDFVAFFLPDLVEQIDFKQPYSFLNKELETLFADSDQIDRRVDKLAKVFLKNGQEQWILIHAEVQGYYDIHFAERMFIYFYRIFDKYQQKIAAIAIFADKRKNWKPSQYEYRFSETSLSYSYPVYKILEQDEQTLLASDNPFAMVILAVKYAMRTTRKDEDLKLLFKLELTELLFKKGYKAAKIIAVFVFLDALIKLSDELQQEIFTQEARKMAIANKKVKIIGDFEEVFTRKGELKGELKGRQKTALKMLADGIAPELISKYTGLTLSEINELELQK